MEAKGNGKTAIIIRLENPYFIESVSGLSDCALDYPTSKDRNSRQGRFQRNVYPWRLFLALLLTTCQCGI